jgi:hypothetical protein
LVGYDQNINTGLKFNQITERDDESAPRVVIIDTEAGAPIVSDNHHRYSSLGNHEKAHGYHHYGGGALRDSVCARSVAQWRGYRRTELRE